MPLQIGTHVETEFERVVDGDTIRVILPGQTTSESVRILALDTEESQAGGTKPVTPWGKAAKMRAEQFFAGSSHVIIEFPGVESLEECLEKYRGNFGRLLVYVYRDGVDFQETMIREGYSPYFMKYGNADFSGHYRRYSRAEGEAQQAQIGVWDQLTVNGQQMCNYAALGTWWNLRDRSGHELRLTGTVPPGGLLKIQLPPHELPLTNSGDEIQLVDPEGALQDRAAYTAADVKAGQAIEFN